MLYGVTALDAKTFGLAPIVLAVIVQIAGGAPARSAARIDPTRILREE